jgi:hypothetical protein
VEDPEWQLAARERDQMLFTLVRAFRRQPRADMWALLLEELRPGLTRRLLRYRGSMALFQRDDLLQEMALALRETALTIPLESDRYLERRLLMRTANRVSRLLKREWRRQQRQDPIEVLEPDEEDETDES